MSQLLATLYPDTYKPPKGRLVPRARVMVTDKELDCSMRNLNRIEKREDCFRYIKSGMKTAAELSDAMMLTRTTVLGYFRELEMLGRCYRIDRGSNAAMWMLAY